MRAGAAGSTCERREDLSVSGTGHGRGAIHIGSRFVPCIEFPPQDKSELAYFHDRCQTGPPPRAHADRCLLRPARRVRACARPTIAARYILQRRDLPCPLLYATQGSNLRLIDLLPTRVRALPWTDLVVPDLLAQMWGPHHSSTLVGVLFLFGGILCTAIYPLATLTNTALGGDWTAANAATLGIALGGSLCALRFLNIAT